MNILNTFRTLLSSLSSSPDAWEWAIADFEARDRRRPPQKNATVFTGSSSITLWDSLEQDMAPLRVLNRGFGGSKINDAARYAGRMVMPYHPRAVVLFAGTNDIAGSKPKTAQEILDGYLAFVKTIQASLTEIPIYFIAITPTPLRWALWSIAEDANHKIKAYTESDPRLRFIDLTDQFLTGQGLPDRGLYRMDGLHPNKKGYARWTAVIKPILLAEVGQDI